MNQTVTDLDKKARLTLEYDKVLDMLAEQAGCDGARERAKRLCPPSMRTRCAKALR